MTIEKIEEAIQEARRFIERAVKAKNFTRREKEDTTFSAGAARAACRRASLDLTKALASMRRGD